MNTTHPTALALALAATLALPALQADPLNRKHVASNAQWILHLDGTAFLRTSVGSRFMEQFVDPKSANGKADLKELLGFDLDWRKVQSATLYGSTFQAKGDPDPTGVLVLKADMGLQAALDRALAQTTPGIRVRKTSAAHGAVYTVNDETHAAFAPEGLVTMARSPEVADKARAVLTGKLPCLPDASTVAQAAPPPAGCFFMAFAEGFAEKADLPPNAAMLKNAQAAQLFLYESGDRVGIKLDIRTPSTDVAQQLLQIGQGLVALTSLNPNQKPEVQSFAQSCRLSANENVVSATASVPTTTVIQKIQVKE